MIWHSQDVCRCSYRVVRTSNACTSTDVVEDRCQGCGCKIDHSRIGSYWDTGRNANDYEYNTNICHRVPDPEPPKPAIKKTYPVLIPKQPIERIPAIHRLNPSRGFFHRQ